MLEVNNILRASPDTNTIIDGTARFLGADSQGFAYLIRLDHPPGRPLTGPFRVRLTELFAAIQAGEVLLGQKITIELVQNLETVSAAARKRVEEAMAILGPLLADEDLLYDKKKRGLLFSNRAEECGVLKRQIRRLYNQFLWGGQTELALVPNYSKRGGPGRPQDADSAKRGRKAKDETNAGKLPLPEVRDNLEKGAKLYYVSGSRTLEQAFMATKKKYYSKGLHIVRNSSITEILLPPDQLPTLAQFRYICDNLIAKLGKHRNKSRGIRPKHGEWDFRGKSRDEVKGPGFRFEIDATKVQIRLVSRYNRARTLKNATLFVIVDVWSGAIVGYALSLHNESWALAARALHNCFTDKQQVFDRLGLDYTSDDWPCHHLPSRLAADRGEMVSNKAGVVSELGIKVEIMPPMCPQRKGKIEASIKDIKHGHSYRLPGRHPKNRQRRETDGTETAALTIDELEKIIVEIIMGLNHDPVPFAHVPPEMVEKGETDVTHIGLYRWGIQHLGGYTRSFPESDVRMSLMSKGTASLTPRGLSFKCQNFRSPELKHALTHQRASGKGNPVVNIRFDEHCADQILFFNTKSNTWVAATNDNEDIQRRKAGFYELELFRNEVELLRRAAKDENLHRGEERGKRIGEIVHQAEKAAKEDRKGVSNAGRRRDRRENTILETAAGDMIANGAKGLPFTSPPALPEPEPTGQENLDAQKKSSPPPVVSG